MDDRLKERFVTVGEFTKTYEAYLARDRLEEEGVRCFLDGETCNELFTFAGINLVRLRVSESEAARAVGILASCCETEVPEDEPFDDEAEANVWLCSVCGEGVPLDLADCPSCRTARTALRSEPSRRWRWRRVVEEAAFQKKEENTTADAPPPAAHEPPMVPQVEERDLQLPAAMSKADGLAGQLFLWSMLAPLLFFFSAIDLLLGVLLVGVSELYLLLLLMEVLARRRELTARGAMAVSLALVSITPAVVVLLYMLRALAQ
jgi:hypothetical protein